MSAPSIYNDPDIVAIARLARKETEDLFVDGFPPTSFVAIQAALVRMYIRGKNDMDEQVKKELK